MSCVACDAVLKLIKEGHDGGRHHSCQLGPTLTRRFFLAAAALPQLIAMSPVKLLSAGELSQDALEKICAECFQVADAMLFAEGQAEEETSRKLAQELLEALVAARQWVKPRDTDGNMLTLIQRAIDSAFLEGVVV